MSKRGYAVTSIFALGVILVVALHGHSATPFTKISPEAKKISEDSDLSRFVLPTDPASRVKLPPGSKIIADSGIPPRHHGRHKRHRAPAGN